MDIHFNINIGTGSTLDGKKSGNPLVDLFTQGFKQVSDLLGQAAKFVAESADKPTDG